MSDEKLKSVSPSFTSSTTNTINTSTPDDSPPQRSCGNRPRTKSNESKTSKKRQRVILLCDLDCFYAQCECIRLGIDCSTVPVALLQWNSALAVNYPARALQIRRGDSYENIRTKSNGKCIALHLPVIPVSQHSDDNIIDRGTEGGEDEAESIEDNSNNNSSSSPIQAAYEKEYVISSDMQRQLLEKERNRMRRPHEGKASLERYRIASSRIFNIILEALSTHIGKTRFVLERASIDELFIDLTEHCYDDNRSAWPESQSVMKSSPKKQYAHNTEQNDRREHDLIGEGPVHAEEKLVSLTKLTTRDRTMPSSCGRFKQLHSSFWREDTVICHEEEHCRFESLSDHYKEEEEKDIIRALQRGCIIARHIRQTVLESLGFTLSVGISTTKLVSKLAASYGKPNGQAVIFPYAIGKIMEETKIKKVRHLGGKIGKKIQALLPPGEETMGSVARFLSLADLSAALGNEMGRMVFDACRGDDGEAVKETLGALTKSITAFKSFRPLSFPALEKWIMLLASDVVARVDVDMQRNERYPKNCNIQYVYLDRSDNRVTRSIRTSFPTKAAPNNSFSAQIKEQLVDRVRVALKTKANFPIHRLGLSAVDFEARPKCGIDSFFVVLPASSAPAAQPISRNPNGNALYNVDIDSSCKRPDGRGQNSRKEKIKSVDPSLCADHDICTKDHESYDDLPPTPHSAHFNSASENTEANQSDLAYARKLQALYDRENTLFSTLEEDRRCGEVNRKRGFTGLVSTVRSNSSGSAPIREKRNRIDNFFHKKR